MQHDLAAYPGRTVSGPETGYPGSGPMPSPSQFTAEKFADVLFSLMLSALLRQDYDPTAVLEIVRRTLY